MFSNRFYFLKLFTAAALVWLACYYNYRQHWGFNPAFWRCQAAPQDYHGAKLWIVHVVVSKILPDGVVISTPGKDHHIEARGQVPPVAVGDPVSFLCTFRRQGSYLDITPGTFHVMRHYSLKRAVMEVASILVFIFALILLLTSYENKVHGGIFVPKGTSR
ncbi:MAG: hypothetical protein FJ279_35060 [Planctomycetes bacterium]|nr:hypothetical protein [Planctomycetota bacterium]MBM4082910.1 hypothetical protein [Planctomycetota bacterium]